MKKFIIIFILLLILSGVCLFLGWMNLYVPADCYGVMLSKTGGYDKELISPDSGFIWRWENILPTNMQLIIFKPSVFTKQLKISGMLPSGEVYAKALGDSSDFSFNIEFSISIRIRFELLIYLVEQDKLTPDNLDQWYNEKMSSLTSQILENIYNLKGKEIILLATPHILESYFIEILSLNFRDIELIHITPILPIKIPDIDHYLLAKEYYNDILQEKKQFDIEKYAKEATLLNENWPLSRDELIQFKKYEAYGELLSKYPILLKYLYIEKYSDQENLILPESNIFEEME